MPGITATNYSNSTARWAGDFGDRKSHIPGGIPLDRTALLAVYTDGNVPSGTLVGRTGTERDANAKFGPFTAGDTETYLTFDDADVNKDVNVAAYRPGNVVYPMHLPAASKVAAALTEIERRYIVNKGRE